MEYSFDASAVHLSGRYLLQQQATELIAADIREKLNLTTVDSLLDVGCGTGHLSAQLSEHVGHITGLDAAVFSEEQKPRPWPPNLVVYESDFPADDPLGSQVFSKALAYSVLHYQFDHNAAFRFIKELLKKLRPGGLLLVGDIPNRDKKERFLRTEAGSVFAEQFSLATAKESSFPEILGMTSARSWAPGDSELFEILRGLRRAGHEAFLLPQDTGLPFGMTREDMLVKRKT